MKTSIQMPQFTSLKAALTTLIYLILVVISAKAQMNGQVTTPCTASMISTFTPCLNYVTGSSSGGSSSTPSSNCCDALKSVMSSSVDCACLLVTASVPLPQLVNRTLALGLPRICQADGVPIKCEASGSPLPAPGPVQFGAPPAASPPSSAFSPPPSSALSPPPSSAFSPQGSKQATASTPASEPTATGLSPVLAPSTTPRVLPVLTPSPSESASMIASPITIWTLLLMSFMFML